MIKPAERISEIQEYYFSRKLKEVAQLNAEGQDIVSLAIGSPICLRQNKLLTSSVRWHGNPIRMVTNPRVGFLSCAMRWQTFIIAFMALN